MTLAGVRAELVAVVLTADGDRLGVLAAGSPLHLPSGPLRTDHHSLQAGVRAFAQEQTGHRLGFVEQLYTFADLDRQAAGERMVSISYLGLTRAALDDGWQNVYRLLPWEDRRTDASSADAVLARLRRWARSGVRRERVAHLFGVDGEVWRPELALQRYELLWEAGLVGESPSAADVSELSGAAMALDHRRILATGLSRVRSKLQYRPVVFELLPETFTLGRLQQVVETLAGQGVHKQNFRRAVEQQHALVEPTGEMTHATGGRPARLYRFRGDVLTEREQAGTKLPIPRSR
ncbi:hypothetical protein G9U51_00170 [Calidifontibacter sp. DB0510]|uniref:NrtR DNA-binding winged helix domain-containing protein n=1 Tax=Metallococcus carri TaxID=1656884 RepID=A0A967EFQ7_9MICO|nr:hypothetical protein [Metallococcus carri]NHN54198.1 hypothetical protein [Metallococcus carri]NOP36962.1 hypothetical protein [Calidifontibacter sp. DB2511S]